MRRKNYTKGKKNGVWWGKNTRKRVRKRGFIHRDIAPNHIIKLRNAFATRKM